MDLSDANLSDLDFSGSDLRNCVLTRAKLFNTNFAGALLDGACLCNTYSRKVCFAAASLRRACLNHIIVQSGQWERSNCESSQWRDGLLENCDFTDTRLFQTTFECSRLLSCHLQRADLRHATLRSTRLASCEFRGCVAHGADWEKSDIGDTMRFVAIFLVAILELLFLSMAGAWLRFPGFCAVWGGCLAFDLLACRWISSATRIILCLCLPPHEMP
jgi:uncharacterized protein YjbI with pentapeptide repeats